MEEEAEAQAAARWHPLEASLGRPSVLPRAGVHSWLDGWVRCSVKGPPGRALGRGRPDSGWPPAQVCVQLGSQGRGRRVETAGGRRALQDSSTQGSQPPLPGKSPQAGAQAAGWFLGSRLEVQSPGAGWQAGSTLFPALWSLSDEDTSPITGPTRVASSNPPPLNTVPRG